MKRYRARALFERGHLDNYLKALNLAETLGDKSMEANMLNGISGIYKIQKDYDKAHEYLIRSYKIFDKMVEGVI